MIILMVGNGFWIRLLTLAQLRQSDLLTIWIATAPFLVILKMKVVRDQVRGVEAWA
jgi:hypothetical protein